MEKADAARAVARPVGLRDVRCERYAFPADVIWLICQAGLWVTVSVTVTGVEPVAERDTQVNSYIRPTHRAIDEMSPYAKRVRRQRTMPPVESHDADATSYVHATRGAIYPSRSPPPTSRRACHVKVQGPVSPALPLDTFLDSATAVV